MSRFYVGVDVQPAGLFFAVIQRSRPHTKLVGLRFESLEGCLNVSSKQANIKDTGRFIDGLRRGIDALAGQEERLALSLPDRCGRVFVVDVDTAFKSHEEGVDILKWRLKSVLPAPPAEVQLDYQMMGSREDGQKRCVVAVIAHPVLSQYEDIVGEAGRHAIQVDFHSLNLYNYYRPRLDPGEEFILVGMEAGLLSIQYIIGKSLCYQRIREFNMEPQRAFREINRTLVDAYDTHPGMKRCAIFAHVDTDLFPESDQLLNSAFEREVKMLNPALNRFSGSAKTGGLQPIGSVVAALGAAERMM